MLVLFHRTASTEIYTLSLHDALPISRLDYDFQKIADQEFILPLKAEVFMSGNKLMYRNETEFRLYRKFGAEATITLTPDRDRKSTRLNSSHRCISYAVFCLKKKKIKY